MAGEWIKLEHGIHHKPEVVRAARILSIEVDKLVGHLIRFWGWVDAVTVDGRVDGVLSHDVDAIVSLPGFCSALKQVGWLEFDDAKQTMSLPNFENHNGETAKKRALKNRRQSKWRAKSVDGPASTTASTREEKRREETTPIVPARFAEFWDNYPGPRKIGKSKCLKVWVDRGFTAVADQIFLHIEAMKLSAQWREADGKYIPAPLTYLNQRRFEDGLPDAPVVRLAV